MAAANIDAVERYVKRIEEYAEDKLNQTKMYKPTVKRIYRIRNMLLRICEKLDKVLEKFGYQVDEVSATDPESARPTYVEPDVDSCESDNPAPTLQVTELEQLINKILDAKLNQTSNSITPHIENTSPEPSTPSTKTSERSINNKKIIAAYKQMFEASKTLDHTSEVVQRTLSFLRDWFDVKILGFYKLQKVSPKLSYNITWIPKWIRDFIVYIGLNADNIESVFDELEDFLHADTQDARYTFIVPYDVASIGCKQDRMDVNDTSSALWAELFTHVFQNLALPSDHSCYCDESLIDHAYLSDTQIQNLSVSATPDYYKAMSWIYNYKFAIK